MQKNTWTTAVALAAVGALGLLLPTSNLVAWESFSFGGGTVFQNVWTTGASSGSATASESIYSGDGGTGAMLVRIGAPVLLLATLAAGACLLFILTRRTQQAGLIGYVAAALGLVGTLLITFGYQQNNTEGGGSNPYNLALGFYAACIGVICAGVAGFLCKQGTAAPSAKPQHMRN